MNRSVVITARFRSSMSGVKMAFAIPVSSSRLRKTKPLAVARSASEAFLYRRLETLSKTKGRFRLNVALPIPFEGQGRMEVDLLCEDGRIAIELDGAQHLENTGAYRRDRRKDMLLQENDYFVLRFLAEDLAKDLGGVLDTILRSLTRCREES